MQELLEYLGAIQPKVNETLAAETGTLNTMVQPVATHVLSAGGKRLRPLLAILFARALGRGGDDIYPLACSVELLHSATLLHDDIIDDAALRRGLPAAHTLFGSTRTILAGDALLALANLIVSRYGDTRLTECIARAIIETATGEIAEIEYLRSTGHPQETYIEIIKGKTAWMIQASCQLGAIAAGATAQQEQAACDFGMNLGIAFQIVDDALDFSPSAGETGKPVAGDLREGKLTPPLHMYLERLEGADRQEFLHKFTTGTFSDADVDNVARAVRGQGLDKATRDLADTYLKKAADALHMLDESREKTVLRQTVDYVKNRSR
ncbi:Trans-hexaprenyltranstransferase [Oleidesulfovibrio alaskensis G20]|jgi:octaprenyl-diphosphate synthase|uniref:Trans-hexaprenyltranstransferase n=1 Tax=Oleidesulfovibrio alaskensis (strain ATCC BAA-1058 / DSM 17464 / G20) TaxID=207559 RepID=Q30WG3_OLEA2|nr:polyprenyl synthetase family protein [Oleidesulfovibrio alaskensis]ABB39983.1 Trans-hexaprenyltranstransferase [Oleidesulfovibrio alaskensis G20]MBG0773335.1 polyprenyl synthetase family protein [Oleidesulfovibrio alaskensis]